MKYDLNTIPNRSNSGSLKWADTDINCKHQNCYPLSTADMEWKTPPQIIESCKEFAEKGMYGYTISDNKYLDCVVKFMSRKHSWDIKAEDITTTYGIISAIHTCIRAFTNEGEGVIIQQPVYGHFESAVLLNNRKLVNNSLVIRNNRYEINFEELEALAKDENNKLLILCSPHNPVGRVWTEEELKKIAEIAINNNLIVVSDEIHFDIVSKKHTVFASLSKESSSITITCTAASKSFNIAGLGTSNIIITNEKLRRIFRNRLAKDGYECINAFAYPAIISAYTECDDWLDEMNSKLNQNIKTAEDYIKIIPDVKYYGIEGTYLMWLDVSFLGIDDDKIIDYIAEKTGYIVNNGGWFGKEGNGFIRINLAGPSEPIIEFFEKLKDLCNKKTDAR